MIKPFALQFMEVLDKRCVLDQKGKRYLMSQSDGYIGEKDFQKIIEANIPSNWQLLNDKYYSLNYISGQIDSILITPHTIYVFEVKNLSAFYEYTDGKWTTNGYELTHDYFHQLNHAVKIIRLIMQENDIKINVEGKLILINENDTVKIDSNMNGHYLKRWHLRHFFQQLQAEAQYEKHNINMLADILNKASSPHPLPKRRLWEFSDDIYNGIVCSNCHQQGINTTRNHYHAICEKCGFAEFKPTMVLRTICELGILYYDKKLTKKFIVESIADPSLKYTIKRVFMKYFKVIPKGNKSYYINPMQKMEFAFAEELKNIRYRNYFVEK